MERHTPPRDIRPQTRTNTYEENHARRDGHLTRSNLTMPIGGLSKPDRVPVGMYGRIPMHDGVESMAGFSTSKFSGEGPGLTSARINALGGVEPIFVNASHPLQAESLRRHKVKKFSGRCEDWEDFERDWNLYLRLMFGSGAVLDDAAVLTNLKGFLDRGSAAQLDADLRRDPNMSFYAFWARLKGRFAKDVQTIHRQNWLKVGLPRPEEKPSLVEWREFMAHYQDKRALVDDWTEAEDAAQVLRQLTSSLRDRVFKEQEKRRQGQHRMRISSQTEGVAELARQDLERVLGHALRVISADGRQCVISCADNAEATQVLEYDGSKYDGAGFAGVPVKIQQVGYTMKGNDILEFVSRLLESEEDNRRYEETLGIARRESPWRERNNRSYRDRQGYQDRGRRDYSGDRQDQRRQVYTTGQSERRQESRADSPHSNESYGVRRDPPSTNNGKPGKGNKKEGQPRQDGEWTEVVRQGGRGKGKNQMAPRGQAYGQQNNSRGKGSQGKGTNPMRSTPLPEPQGTAEPQTPNDLITWCKYCRKYNKPWHHHYANCQYRLRRQFGPADYEGVFGPNVPRGPAPDGTAPAVAGSQQ